MNKFNIIVKKMDADEQKIFDKLSSGIPEDFKKDRTYMIAGGAIVSALHNLEPRDIDIFYTGEEYRNDGTNNLDFVKVKTGTHFPDILKDFDFDICAVGFMSNSTSLCAEKNYRINKSLLNPISTLYRIKKYSERYNIEFNYADVCRVIGEVKKILMGSIKSYINDKNK